MDEDAKLGVEKPLRRQARVERFPSRFIFSFGSGNRSGYHCGNASEKQCGWSVDKEHNVAGV